MRVNSCALDTSFFEGVQQQKKLPKTPGNAFSDALLEVRFEKLKSRFARFYLINESIN